MSSNFIRAAITAASIFSLSACGDSDSNNIDSELRSLIAEWELTGDPSQGREVADINSDKAQLGKKLFFSKSLSGEFESGCVTCHHPTLGFGDDLSLAIGTEAIEDDLLGPGRLHISGLPPHPRNSPTTLNVLMWDQRLFWDGRLESQGKTAERHGNDNSGIRTPETPHDVVDANAMRDLTDTFAGFPVTEPDEMAGFTFQTDKPQGPIRNAAIRDHLAARLGNYGVGEGELDANSTWLAEFQTAFNSNQDAETLITQQNIRNAIGTYLKSQVFVETPWKAYVDGDTDALNAAAKRGARLFFTKREDGGFECASCHRGDFFTNESFYVIAMPQIGPGKGGPDGDDDFGRARETQNIAETYKFRVPTLLNVEVTEPYNHVGSYQTLEDTVRHHLNPAAAIDTYFANSAWCDLPQYSVVENCEDLFPNAETNTRNALAQLEQNRANFVPRVIRDVEFSEDDVADVVEFLKALTDPCVKDRDCLLPWIADTDSTGPDGNQLNAVDGNGNLL